MKYLLILFLIALFGCSNDNEDIKLPNTENGWYVASQVEETKYNGERKLAILLKVIHMRFDSIIKKADIQEPNIDRLDSLKSSLHTKEWQNNKGGESTPDPRLTDMYTLANNLYIRLKNFDIESGGDFEYTATSSEYSSDYSDGDKVGEVDVKAIQKIVEAYAKKKGLNAPSDWRKRWTGKF